MSSNMFKCVHLCSNLFKTCSSVIICVQMCSNVFKCVHLCSNLFKTCSNVFKCDQTCLKLVQMCWNVFKLVQNLFKCVHFIYVQTCSKLFLMWCTKGITRYSCKTDVPWWRDVHMNTFIHSPVNPLLVDIASYNQSLSSRLCLVIFYLPLLTFSILILLFTLINHINHVSHILL